MHARRYHCTERASRVARRFPTPVLVPHRSKLHSTGSAFPASRRAQPAPSARAAAGAARRSGPAPDAATRQRAERHQAAAAQLTAPSGPNHRRHCPQRYRELSGAEARSPGAVALGQIAHSHQTFARPPRSIMRCFPPYTRSRPAKGAPPTVACPSMVRRAVRSPRLANVRRGALRPARDDRRAHPASGVRGQHAGARGWRRPRCSFASACDDVRHGLSSSACHTPRPRRKGRTVFRGPRPE